MRKVFKWVGIGLGSLIVLFLIAGFAMYMIGGSNLTKTYEVPETTLTVVSDSASLARGEHLTKTMGCRECHGEDLSGQILEDAPPFRVVPANLTPGGVTANYSDADFERAIRHGVRPDGRALLIMPSLAYHGLADEDVAAIIAYLRSLEPIENDLPPTEVRTMGRLLSAGPFDPGFEVNVAPSPTSRPPVGATAEYGAYLFGTLCFYCHGADGQGMEKPPGPPGMPPSPALAAAARWSFEEFRQTLRTGVTPGGKELDPIAMPWRMTAQMTDAELEGLYIHLHSLMEADNASVQAVSDS